MGGRDSILRRPVSVAAMVALAVASLGAGAAFIPGGPTLHVLAFGAVYGAFLSWYAVGLTLAARSRGAIWFWVSGVLPFGFMALVANGYRLAPGGMLRWWSVVGSIGLGVLSLWLATGLVVAAWGWRGYTRGGGVTE